ncbi:uncharacterized protein [Panulirus ornatus]|uniref:uncharacterized protein isoform X2 n=1 Tax=Panulirus ornatus TaxID=150431 RepID=UPI003A841F48
MKLLQVLVVAGAVLGFAWALPQQGQCDHGTYSNTDCNTCYCDKGVEICTQMDCSVEKPEIPPNGKCLPGSRWKDKCNWCSCTETGIGICSKKACLPDYVEEAGEPVCLGNSGWTFDDCNWCHCRSGVPGCTKKMCPKQDQAQCVEGTTYNKDCNTCRCSNGMEICTLMSCLPEVEEQKLPDNAECLPGSRWMNDCNWCSCTETGIPICSLMACVPGFEPEAGEPTCDSGSRWKMDDCNWCTCRNGVQACTKRMCRQERDVLANLPDDAVCVPGSRWKLDCNWCNCVGNGTSLCTLRGCLPGYNPEPGTPSCEGNSMWKVDDCNWCKCAGGSSLCTKRICSSEQNEPECQGDPESSYWRVACNRCRCLNGKPSCTRKLCPSDFQERFADAPDCEGTASWKDDCNTCNCVNGSAVCTSKHCGAPIVPAIKRVSTRINLREESPTCSEGSRWRESCNWCTCNNGTGSCTKMKCPDDFQTDEPECEHGSSWMMDCNWCICGEGLTACTRMRCSTSRLRTSPRRAQITQNEVTCTSGSKWRDSCNWCTCFNGTGACTLKGCPSDFQTDEPECEPDAQWKKDCNWCSCIEGQGACTKMACVSSKIPKEVCTEGDSWREDCNICRCSEGHAICTKKMCVGPDTEKHLCIEGNEEGCGIQNLPPHCKLPSVSDGAVCGAFMSKWTFDITTKKCKEIVYGGCKGTENLYETEAECKASCSLAIVPASRTSIRLGSKEQCLKKQDTGPCFSNFIRYSYNAESGLCEEFTYGGCQGNDNNFVSAEECIEVCEGVTPHVESSCDRSKCPWQRWGHYLAKNCLPQYEGGSCCPSSFICSSADEAQQDPEKCYYKGSIYEIGSSVPVEDPCSAGCFCSPSRITGNPAEIVCANVECPSLFRPLGPGCRPLYRPGECCSYDTHCDDPENPPELESHIVSCIWNNKTYLEGDQMFFDDYPCQKCICGPSFVDPNGPGCSKVSCGLDFRYSSRYFQGCTPIYFEDKCCPIDWLCPGDSRIQPAGSINPEASSRNIQGECIIGDEISQAPTPPHSVTVTGVLDYRFPGSMSLQVGWSPPECPHGDITAYRVLYRENPHREDNEQVEWIRRRIQGNLRTQLILSGLDPLQAYVVGVAAENIHGLSDISHQVVFSLVPRAKSAECYLGDLYVALGSPLEINECKIDCRCITPPEITCVQHRSCDKAAETRATEECPEPICDDECHTIMDAATGCRICSCSYESFSCPQQTCPSNCEAVVDFQTGCSSCKCSCSYDALGFPPCPTDCDLAIFMDEVTGCQRCECIFNNPNNSLAYVGIIEHNRCPKDHTGRAPCPQDCAVHRVFDEETGCEKCVCDPNISVNALARQCITDFTGRAPCPMDCAVHYVIDNETGCEKCECDPNNPATPFGPYKPLS